jgi:hypothetical protein
VNGTDAILARLMEMIARLLDEGNRQPFIFSAMSEHGTFTGGIDVDGEDVDADLWTSHVTHPDGLGVPVTFTVLDARGVVTVWQITEAGENRIIN